MPSLEQYKDKILVLYGCTNASLNPIQYPTEMYVDIIRKHIANGKTKVIFFNSPEGLIKPITRKIQAIAHVLKELPKDTIYINSAGLEAKRIYNEYCDKHNLEKLIGQLISHNYQWVMGQSKHFLNNHFQGKEIEYNIKIKSKKFNCFNKIHRYHRLELLARMVETKLFDLGYYSFEGGSKGWQELILKSDLYPINIKKLIIEKKFPIRLEGGIREDRHNPIAIEEGDLVYHDDSYFSVITETLFYQTHEEKNKLMLSGNMDGVFLSEKTYRPILLKHPFILFAMPNSLSELRKAGYKTFSPYIDESYDTIQDGNERFNAVFKEIQRLCAFTDEEWLTWQANIKPIVDHNHRILVNKSDHAVKDYGYLFRN